jgi:hypothetical protein
MTVPVSFGIVVRTVILYGANMMNGLDKSKLISIIGIFGIFLVTGNSIAIGGVLFTDSFDSGVVSSERSIRTPTLRKCKHGCLDSLAHPTRPF